MRTAFVDTLLAQAQHDPRIVLMVGDLGFGVVIPFREQLPNQFVNAGVAEQNMTGMAAGMALSGKIVFTYSIANFPGVAVLGADPQRRLLSQCQCTYHVDWRGDGLWGIGCLAPRHGRYRRHAGLAQFCRCRAGRPGRDAVDG